MFYQKLILLFVYFSQTQLQLHFDFFLCLILTAFSMLSERNKYSGLYFAKLFKEYPDFEELKLKNTVLH